jgi:hypothetical protein
MEYGCVTVGILSALDHRKVFHENGDSRFQSALIFSESGMLNSAAKGMCVSVITLKKKDPSI